MRSLTLLYILFYSSALGAPDYGAAIDAAKRSALIQSGVQSRIDQIQHSAESKGTAIVKDLGMDLEVGTAAYLYRCYRDQSLHIPLGNNRTLTLKPNGVDMVYSFPFPWE